ncbi:hypothetical protein [Ralstonia mannitolilytica]|uniref:hypothetical protein n=1 Tax=Ralstonia mannitolilytica TaxID=105219 RepID=UPI0028F515D7|nr:hypothetical protein [Ralstonia mannitolilytica]CAJ0858313.1 hypothetical protein R76727_01245 [Ralstonia mannitolilytica]
MTDTRLVFGTPYSRLPGSAVKLVFSLAPDVPVTTVTGTLRRKWTLQGSATAQPAATRFVTGTLRLHTVQSVQGRVYYDNSVWRGPGAMPAAGYEEATPISPTKAAWFEQADNLRDLPTALWATGTHLNQATAGIHEEAQRIKGAHDSGWEPGAPLATARRQRWDYPPHIKLGKQSSWETPTSERTTRGDAWEYPPHVRVVKRAAYEETVAAVRSLHAPAGQGTKLRRTTRAPWEEAKWAPFGHEIPVIPPEPPEGYEPSTAILFQCPWLAYAGSDIRLVFGKYPCKEVEPPEHGTIIVPVKRVYIVINNVLLRRVDGNVELPTTSLSLNIEADGWTWSFNASIERSAEDAVASAADGTPVELEAVFNGVPYRLLAEETQRDREFGKAIVRVSGRGKSALLDEPTAPILSFANSQARTAQQLMNDALTINGASIGWTVDWRLTDWLVPAGAWVHQGTYKSALQAIAGAAGAYIQPDPALQKLSVLARYPVAPWNWGTVTPDFVLPSDVTSREGIRRVRRPRYTRVFVSGQAQGVLGQVTRAGTDGSILAPMVTDPLITHVDAARQRGLAILGDTGNQAHLSLRLPILQETGIILPGKFVQYVDEGVTRLGLVRGTAVETGMPEAWQTIGVETHVA